jgi:hypothetical protein
MRPLLTLFVWLLLSLQSAAAQEPYVMLDGELFAKQSVAHLPSGDTRIEYVREDETFDDWTKKISFRHQTLPGIENDPRKAAAWMSQLVKAYNDQSQSNVIVNKETSEALIDFLTWPPEAKHREFHIFRFARSADEDAVESLEFAYRLTDETALDSEQFRKIRASWIKQAVAFDMDTVHAALAEQDSHHPATD